MTADTTRRPTRPDPRERALSHLLTIVDYFPDLPIDAPDAEGLDPRDAALLRAIDGAVRRRWLTLRGVVSTFLNRPFDTLDPVAQAALLVGAAQLLLLDRIPDHAAIDSSVGWVKRVQGKGIAGLVNAVLRNVARRRDVADTRALVESPGTPSLQPGELPLPDGRVLGDMLPNMLPSGDATESLSVQCSLAPSLVAAWIDDVGIETATHRALCSIVPAPTIVRFDPRDGLPSGLQPHARPGYAIYDTTAGPIADLVRDDDARWVQDPGSAAALESIADLRPTLIVDLCAGRGTKTRQLAAIFPDARIVAADPDAGRLATLRAAVRDDDRIIVTTHDGVERHAVGADLAVVDVPCSNTGVLSRRLEARYRHDPRRQAGLVALQREILERAIRLVAPGGHVLYATCSLETEENGHAWSAIAADADGRTVEVLRTERREPEGLPGEPQSGHLDGGGTTLLRVL